MDQKKLASSAGYLSDLEAKEEDLVVIQPASILDGQELEQKKLKTSAIWIPYSAAPQGKISV